MNHLKDFLSAILALIPSRSIFHRTFSCSAVVICSFILHTQLFSVTEFHDPDFSEEEIFDEDEFSVAVHKSSHRRPHKPAHEHCDGKAGPRGVAGLLNFAAFEWSVPPHSTPPAIAIHQPIPFYRQRALEGKAIETSYPYDGFTLAKGEYQITVGLANNGGSTGPAKDFQISLFINNQRVFIWPALDDPKTNAAPFVSFTTIINAEGTSSFLQVVAGATVVYDKSETGGTIAYLNIFKLDPGVPGCHSERTH